MNNSTAIRALGLIFAAVGVGVYLFTLKKPEFPPARNKGDLRERAVLADNNRKLRIAAGLAVGFGALLLIIS